MFFSLKINLTATGAKKFVIWGKMDVGIAKNACFQYAGNAILEVNNYGKLSPKNKTSKNKTEWRCNDLMIQ